MKSELPPNSVPRLWCDLNACGWSGAPDDNCYYALHRVQLAALSPAAGMKVFIWDWSDSESVVGFEASLERFGDAWRARPTNGTPIEAKADETFRDLP
jgi:hypothetical protein